MAKNRTKTSYVDYIPDADLPAFKRTQWFETSKIAIQIFLMCVFAVSLFAFILLIILAGVTNGVLSNTLGVRALSELFIEITANAKTVVLFALGFFFREYLNTKNSKNN